MDIHDLTLIEEICCSRDIPLDGRDCDIPAKRNLHHIELARQKVETFNTPGIAGHNVFRKQRNNLLTSRTFIH